MGILGGNHTSPASAGNAATAAQSAKAHPANGIRPESAQPRPHARPPPAHDGTPVKARAPPPFWREFKRERNLENFSERVSEDLWSKTGSRIRVLESSDICSAERQKAKLQ